MSETYTIPELAKLFDKKYQTISQWIHTGVFGAFGVGWKKNGPSSVSKIIVYKEVADKVLEKYN